MKIWIKNATILTMDKDKELLFNANVYIENEYIIHVGSKLTNFLADKVIDAKNNLIMPGLINCHTHAAMAFLRNKANDLNLEDWLFNHIFPIENLMDKKDVYNGAKLGIYEMIASGTTTFVDMYFFEEQTLKAAQEMNIRAICGLGTGGADNIINDRIDTCKNLYTQYNNNLLKVIIAPHSVYTNGLEALKKINEAIFELNNLTTIHLNESQKEIKDSINTNGMTPIELANQIGILDHRTLIAHATYMNDNEIKIIQSKSNVSLVHNPCSNLKLASGIMPIQKYLDAKINVTLGTDGAASNNTLDMFETMKFASLLAKGSTCNPLALNAYETLKLVTVNGAKAIGMEDKLGKIKKNYLADLIFVNIHNLHHQPLLNIIDSLVYSTKSSDVYTSIINGKIVYENYKFKNDDLEKTIDNINNFHEKLKNQGH